MARPFPGEISSDILVGRGNKYYLLLLYIKMSLNSLFLQQQEQNRQQLQQLLQQDQPAQQQQEQHDEQHDVIEGGRKPDWIVGRIYADWCGHCVQMKEMWNRLKKDMKKKKGGAVVLIDIQDMEMGHKLPKLNKTYFQKGNHAGVKSSGFPTIFMFQVSNPGNTLEYYKGARDYLSMKSWIENKTRRRKPAKMNRMKGGKKTKKMRGRKQGTRKVKKI